MNLVLLYLSPHFFIAGSKAINAVCRIEFDAAGEGTGFLIAPDLVLTNYHVFKPYGTSYNIHNRAKHCQVRFKAKRNEKGEEEPQHALLPRLPNLHRPVITGRGNTCPIRRPGNTGGPRVMTAIREDVL